jgi:hypothetical protein
LGTQSTSEQSGHSGNEHVSGDDEAQSGHGDDWPLHSHASQHNRHKSKNARMATALHSQADQ